MDRLETVRDLCTTHLNAGNNYMQLSNYKAAIQEFTKVIELLPEFIDLTAEFFKTNPPLELRIINIDNIKKNAQVAYMGRALSYLAIDENDKAKADRDMADKIENKNSLEEIKSELTGGDLTGCISIIIFIVLGYILFFH